MVAPPPPLFVYADFEAMQNAEGVFVANLLCYSTSEETTIHVLDGEDCALQFLRHLDDLTDIPDREGEREILVVFHNLKRFDGMFILHELYQQQREVVDQLTVGAKVLSFKSGAVKFIDSLCFLPMPLASFPSTFNLTELKKGFFPHLFNTPDHQQYVGRIPDLEFYDPDGMMAKKKDELSRWHADQVRRNVPFHFKHEMIEYCKSDVALLKAGCEAFQQEFERQAGFNPMAKCITIASACNMYWRKHHLTPDTIAVEPLGDGEGPSYFVDGYDPLTRTVYEFYGCLYHGCPTWFPVRDTKHYATPDRTVEELYQATLSKRMALLRAGYTVIEMWECEWDRLVDNEPVVSQFLASFDLVPPLELREAFFGGRTGALTFPLCRTCVQEEQAQPMLTRTHYCPHSDVDRTLRGTWCTPELVKAVEKGYTLIKIHEVWHFPPEQRQTGLFANYVNTWLKIKQESAGWPSWCQTLEQAREGIRLDVASIAKNPGRKATAKLMLNSFWGKFGERINKPTTVTVQNPAHLFSLISDAALDISILRLYSPQDSRRNLNIVTPHHFKRDLEQKKIQVVPRVKQYGLVFDKRVIHVATKSSYPYG
ncbi:unnamed protein product [Porites lobata]|uniref:DNA-directed DNA polymerase n=1 Tax=Porites lobata TaxID=104759 RepID=A0ABN8QVJ3_9CNID|nr:unnamed protein product [Porites lobata]